MRVQRIEDRFPKLATVDYAKTSDEDEKYNCVAWALYDTGQWWELVIPGRNIAGYYWPIERDDRLQDWTDMFRLHGYQPTDSAGLEDGFERIAIYTDTDGTPQHAARQLASGKWTSKIGRWEDIEHGSPFELEGGDYGTIAIIMKRTRSL